MREWSNRPVLKPACPQGYRGFESPSAKYGGYHIDITSILLMIQRLLAASIYAPRGAAYETGHMDTGALWLTVPASAQSTASAQSSACSACSDERTLPKFSTEGCNKLLKENPRFNRGHNWYNLGEYDRAIAARLSSCGIFHPKSNNIDATSG